MNSTTSRDLTSVSAPTWSAWRQAVIDRPPALHLDGTVAYVEGWALLVPTDSGVYLMHDLRGFLYIGRTRNLNARYRQHYWATHNPNLLVALRQPIGQTQFSWTCCDDATAADLERDLIRGFQPLCNQIRFTS
ncbi:GIY-YIG nuclease family protein [Pseudonocardia sp. KRD-184]|uniref:GIY-YIG nuclease family protein n=1 Tax=Pseudonocardia oceani TaxID=2792013 RepID=A0ABS6UJW9_9PSEU|nr:GIY-YIG nuclease family protein [Pseudonocardia oceani]MBW0090529.1 GIY-YIG nuclease family protein [Pseudonocardia oceani]MBW0095348.1 GIY-YIG nuclease family protein [Pseudonocardia oceani]MBW0108118.1 GIY-YIG nuclease family protein [Pseudonocardia oceani]MBW0120070.1 GIY-YIG nuclease family protein [Pseudonocardia oceani]MBW0132526.1 GIY-YIG nuclease family protein [Pseudonocardia oceani]